MMRFRERDKKVIRYIDQFQRQHGCAPAIRDIQEAIGFSSTSLVRYNLLRLERAGMIRRERMRSRAIVLTDQGRALLEGRECVQFHAPFPEELLKALRKGGISSAQIREVCVYLSQDVTAEAHDAAAV